MVMPRWDCSSDRHAVPVTMATATGCCRFHRGYEHAWQVHEGLLAHTLLCLSSVSFAFARQGALTGRGAPTTCCPPRKRSQSNHLTNDGRAAAYTLTRWIRS